MRFRNQLRLWDSEFKSCMPNISPTTSFIGLQHQAACAARMVKHATAQSGNVQEFQERCFGALKWEVRTNIICCTTQEAKKDQSCCSYMVPTPISTPKPCGGTSSSCLKETKRLGSSSSWPPLVPLVNRWCIRRRRKRRIASTRPWTMWSASIRRWCGNSSWPPCANFQRKALIPVSCMWRAIAWEVKLPGLWQVCLDPIWLQWLQWRRNASGKRTPGMRRWKRSSWLNWREFPCGAMPMKLTIMWLAVIFYSFKLRFWGSDVYVFDFEKRDVSSIWLMR